MKPNGLSGAMKAHGYAVDYIISHTGPYEVISELGYETQEEAREQIGFLQNVADQVDFGDWYFGHFHIDRYSRKYKFHALYESWCRI